MISQEHIVYESNGLPFEGVICRDDSLKTKRPGVLVSHAWFGQGDFEIEKAKALAQQGYVAFAIDMYGQGRRAADEDEAGKLMNECVDDRIMLRSRILKALEVLQNHPDVDTNRIGAIGFCFGGRCVLDLARSGADIRGVVSFHGIYDPPPIDYAIPIKASVLVLHGWEDPLALPEQTVALGQELTERKADWQILAFGHTGHAFTNPNAHSKKDGMYYQPSSSRRAWQAMNNFFDEIFSI